MQVNGRRSTHDAARPPCREIADARRPSQTRRRAWETRMTEQQLPAYSPAPPARPVSPRRFPALIDLPHPDLDGGPS